MERIERLEDLGELDFGMDNLVQTQTKIALKILCDNSDSMNWYRGLINLHQALKVFIDTLNNDDYARASVDVSISTFNHDVNNIIPFTSVDNITIDEFKAIGGTDIAKAVEEGLEDIKKQNQYYLDNDIKFKQPWIVLLTDCDTAKSNLDSVVQKTRSLVDNGKLTMLCIGTGTEVNTDQLKRFTNKPVLHSPEPEDLIDLFEWISVTVSGYSQTGSNEKFESVPLENRRIEFV